MRLRSIAGQIYHTENRRMATVVDLREIKKRYKIKIKEFHKQQAAVLGHLLDNKAGKQNILYMAPTANGKTLPPLVKILEDRRRKPKKMTLWFMPTISLTDDFMKRIGDNGNYRKLVNELGKVKIVRFTGEDSVDKANHKVKMAKTGDPDILVISPESLKDPAFMAWLLDSSKRNIGQIVLDEAHLFDEWGITFRRAYFIVSWLISTLRERNGDSFKVIALSASLPEDKMAVVMRMLHFEDADTFISRSLALPIGPRITCHTTKGKKEKKDLLLKILKRNLNKTDKNGNKYKGVIFSPYIIEESRAGKLEWSVKSMEKNIIPRLKLEKGEWALYTGGIPNDKRKGILDDLHKKKGKIRLLLATSAFGFGVDIKEVDFSIHIEMPEDIDRLYQEISRCSREPMKGYADIFYNSQEVAAQTRRLAGTLKAETIRAYLEYLNISRIKKGNKTLSIKNVLRQNEKTFKSQRRAQMSADAYFDHALEAIIFLYRHNIIELRPIQNNNFPPKKISILRNAFENGKSSGYRMVRYGGQDVFIPSIKFPIRITKNVHRWSKIANLVKEDKTLRSNRTAALKKIGKNRTCHWKVIANHYGLQLQNKKERILDECNYCNVCRSQ